MGKFDAYTRRPLCLFCVSFISGILLCSFFGILFVLIFLALSLFFIFIFFNKIKKAMFIVIISLAFLAFGGISLYNAEKTYSKTFNGFYNQPVTVEGYVDSETESSDGKLKFYMKTNKIICKQKENKVIGKLLIILSDNNGYLKRNNAFSYRATIYFTGNIEKPKSAVNPGGFNYKRYLAGLGVSGTVYLRNSSDIGLTGFKGGGWLQKLGFSIKNYVLKIIDFCLDKNQAGLLSGMIIGYKDGLDENAYNAFSKAGLTHIMVAVYKGIVLKNSITKGLNRFAL